MGGRALRGISEFLDSILCGTRVKSLITTQIEECFFPPYKSLSTFYIYKDIEYYNICSSLAQCPSEQQYPQRPKSRDDKLERSKVYLRRNRSTRIALRGIVVLRDEAGHSKIISKLFFSVCRHDFVYFLGRAFVDELERVLFLGHPFPKGPVSSPKRGDTTRALISFALVPSEPPCCAAPRQPCGTWPTLCRPRVARWNLRPENLRQDASTS